jgi:murein DD-endopeptidase MepM/ murein hydrolase activator NlpD
MPILRRPSTRAVVATLALTLLLGAGFALSQGARAAGSSSLQNQISSNRAKASNLATAVGAASKRVGALDSSISDLQLRISMAQARLDAERAQLLSLRGQLESARTRLAELQSFAHRAEQALSAQLVNSYETEGPDIVSVVLEAHGFSDLLERLAFAQRIRDQDARVVGAVRAARRAVAAEAIRLGSLEQRQQSLTVRMLQERNSLVGERSALQRAQSAAAQVKTARAGQLARVRARIARLQNQLASVLAPSPPSASAPSASASTPTSQHGTSSQSGFTFPLPKGSIAPEAAWSLDNGVDISGPGGTPEFAVCSGTVVLHGIGGFGPSAPVLHCDAPLSGYDYVYYGHAGPGNWVPIGTHVSAGQAISEIGSGIVGISTGPHLEIGFADAAGSPVGPQSAPTMMALLRSSF